MYTISRHIWLQMFDERVQARNVLTGRRALLSQDELTELESFCAERAVSQDSPLHQRFIQADLLVSPSSTVETPRLEGLQKRVTRFLCERHGLNRRKLQERFPDFSLQLDDCRQILGEDVSARKDIPEEGRKIVLRDLDVVLDHVATFMKTEMESQSFRFSEGFLSSTVGRPLPREDYEQQPCMPETSQRRVELAKEHLKEKTRGLILGDDDLLSIYWGAHLSQECDVFELDDALLEYLPRYLPSHLTLNARDLTQGLPSEFRGRYDLIFTDPMYERSGMDLFIKCCAEGLNESPEARVLFTTRPDMIDDGELLEQRFTDAGLALEKQIPNFSRYRLPDFYRRKLLKGFHAAGVSPQLVDGLCQIPYLYADLFWLKKA